MHQSIPRGGINISLKCPGLGTILKANSLPLGLSRHCAYMYRTLTCFSWRSFQSHLPLKHILWKKKHLYRIGRYYKAESKRHELNTAHLHSVYPCIAVKLMFYKLRYHSNEYQSWSKSARFSLHSFPVSKYFNISEYSYQYTLFRSSLYY